MAEKAKAKARATVALETATTASPMDAWISARTLRQELIDWEVLPACPPGGLNDLAHWRERATIAELGPRPCEVCGKDFFPPSEETLYCWLCCITHYQYEVSWMREQRQIRSCMPRMWSSDTERRFCRERLDLSLDENYRRHCDTMIRKMLLEYDGFQCDVCRDGKRLDPSLPEDEPDAAVVGYIQQPWDGGDLWLRNLQLQHKRCRERVVRYVARPC
jgi:hypothetical protein